MSYISCLAIYGVILFLLWFQAELQYLHDYAGVNAAIGLTWNPLLNLSGVIGTNTFAAGVDVAFDTATGNFTKYNSAASFTNVDLIASIALWVIFENPNLSCWPLECKVWYQYCMPWLGKNDFGPQEQQWR